MFRERAFRIGLDPGLSVRRWRQYRPPRSPVDNRICAARDVVVERGAHFLNRVGGGHTFATIIDEQADQRYAMLGSGWAEGGARSGKGDL